MAETRHGTLHEQGDFTAQYDECERRSHKAVCVLAYLPVLCLLSLLFMRTRYVRFHVSPGLSLFLSILITNAVIVLLGYLLGFLFSVLASVFYLLALLVDASFLCLTLIGVDHALTERARELPLVGQARILK